jgi:sRNA-binding protein
MAKKKRMPQAEYDAAIDLLLHLRARFPNVISRLNQQYGRRPLKIDIRDDLAALFPEIEPQTIGQALKICTLHSGYLRALVEGAPRVDLNGAEVGSVTAEVAGHARELLERSGCVLTADELDAISGGLGSTVSQVIKNFGQTLQSVGRA